MDLQNSRLNLAYNLGLLPNFYILHVVITRTIRTDFKYRYERSNLVIINFLNFVFKTIFLTSQIRILYPCLFTYSSSSRKTSCFQRIYQVQNLVLYMNYISEFMAFLPSNGIKPHHHFFICSRSIIVQQWYFVLKSKYLITNITRLTWFNKTLIFRSYNTL